MAALTICSDFGAQKTVCHCFHCFPIYLPWSDGTRCMILVFWMLSFKPTFSLSSFTFIKRLFSSSLLSAIRVVSSAYLRLLIFLLEILIRACASSNLAFLMIYFAFMLNKQGDYMQPWHIPFHIWNQPLVSCPVLTETGNMVWYSHLFHNFPQFVVIHTVNSFGIVNKSYSKCISQMQIIFCTQKSVCHLFIRITICQVDSRAFTRIISVLVIYIFKQSGVI